MQDQTKTAFPKEAATILLESEILAHKSHGDHITAKEVLEVTSMPVEAFRGRLKTWAKKNKFKLVAVKNDGYRIAMPQEHTTLSVKSQKAALKKEREGLRTLAITDASKLDDTQARRLEFQLPRTAARVARGEQDLTDTNKEFKLTERVPLRALTEKF